MMAMHRRLGNLDIYLHALSWEELPMLVTDCHCCVIEESWQEIAVVAWSGYLNSGRGVVVVDTTRASSTPSRHLMMYQPVSIGLAEDEANLAQHYDPRIEAVVCIIDSDGRHSCRAGHAEITPPAAYSRNWHISPGLTH